MAQGAKSRDLLPNCWWGFCRKKKNAYICVWYAIEKTDLGTIR